MTARPEYAVTLDSTYDAVLLRDLCRDAAQKAHTRAANATQRHALNRNMEKFECFSKYAERFEHIRLEEARRIVASMKS